jgi:adenosylcobinamide kinase/adenosylcobinamide-phosphate guanylyltransferase
VSKLILITGGVKSGKSSFAVSVASKEEGNVVFVATAKPTDEEMKKKIEEHRRSRPQSWQTLEISRNLLDEVRELKGDVLLVDCITLYISQKLSSRKTAEEEVLNEISELARWAKKKFLTSIFVTNEVGSGVVPETFLGRVFSEVLGKTNQLLAEEADEVYFLVAGIPLKIK